MKYNPYSISKLGSYLDCPLKFKFKYIDKIKVPFTYNLALYKGVYIHQILEEKFNYNKNFKTNTIFTEEEKIKAENTVREFEKSDLGQYYKRIMDNPKIEQFHEEDFAFKIKNSNLVLCGYNDPDAWIRGSIDLNYIESETIYLIDWKSGKSKVNEEGFGIDQSMAYSIYLMLRYPKLDKVVSKFVFVEHHEEKEIVYYRKYFKDYIKHFYNLTKIVETDNIHEAAPTTLCNWCDFLNHGICTKPEEKEEAENKLMNSTIALDF